jgi:hypothetical protein
VSARGPDDQIAHVRVSVPSDDLVLSLKPGRRILITDAALGSRHVVAVIQDQSGQPVWGEPLAAWDRHSLLLPDGHYSLVAYEDTAPVHSSDFEVRGRPLELAISP